MTQRAHSEPRRARGVWILHLVAIAIVSEACTIPSPIEPRADRIAWSREPTIATDTPSLRPLVRDAIAEWGWGQMVDECLDADICLSRDAMEGGRRAWGTASWEPTGATRCHADVMIESYQVVAHELGHCFGLGHSEDRRSLMNARTQDGARFPHVTRADLAALDAIRRGVPANREEAARRDDGWFSIRNARASQTLEARR